MDNGLDDCGRRIDGADRSVQRLADDGRQDISDGDAAPAGESGLPKKKSGTVTCLKIIAQRCGAVDRRTTWTLDDSESGGSTQPVPSCRRWAQSVASPDPVRAVAEAQA